jgi:hypothetical protein
MKDDLKDKLKNINTKSTGSFFMSIGFPLLILIVMAYLFSYGYVGYKLWNWFVLPIFVNNGAVQIGTMIGVFLLVKLFCMKLDIENILESKSEEKIGLIVVSTFGMPWLSLGIGYLVKFLLL